MFELFLGYRLLTMLATEIIQAAIPLLIYQKTSSVACSGLAFTKIWLPRVLLQPVMGTLVDAMLNIKAKDINLPQSTSYVDVSWYAVDPDGATEDELDPRLNIVAQSLISPPKLLRVDPRVKMTSPPQPIIEENASFASDDMSELLLSAVLFDGVEIPYRVALPNAVKANSVLIVFTAYGGFGLNADTGYLRLLGKLLLEQGIGCGIAYIRGYFF